MKMTTKEILKNKTDKMVDLIIDEIGEEGEKTLTTSFIDKHNKTKYITTLKIQSGAPEELIPDIAEEDLSDEIQNIKTQLVELQIKEDNDTIYDDTEIRERIEALEGNITPYDDAGIKARLTILEEKVANLEAQNEEQGE